MSAPGREPDWFEHVLGLRETVARIDERIGGLERRMDAFENGLERLESEVGSLRKTLYALHAAQVAGLLGVIATLLATQ